MPSEQTTAPGAAGWMLLSAAVDYGEAEALPEAVALFDAALAESPSPSWHHGRGMARARLADESGDSDGWAAALDDLWRAWAQPHPDVDREVLASDLAETLTHRPREEGDLAALDRLLTDLDRLDEPDIDVPTVQIARGIARLERYQAGADPADRYAGTTLLRAALQAAPDDAPLLRHALWMFAAGSEADGALEQALTAVERLRALEDPHPDLNEVEARLLVQFYWSTEDRTVADAVLQRLDDLCAGPIPLPGALIACGAAHVSRTAGPGLGPHSAPDLDTAVRVLTRGLQHTDGDTAAVGLALLGMAHYRRAELTDDDGERLRAIACYDEALCGEIDDVELELTAHTERLQALVTNLDLDATRAPTTLIEAFDQACGALAAQPGADLRSRAELALALARAELTMIGKVPQGVDAERVKENLDLGARHPDPPSEWASTLAVLRAGYMNVVEYAGHGTGHSGVAELADALPGSRYTETMRRMIAHRAVHSGTRSGALHGLESGAALLRSSDAPPLDLVLAAMADIELVRRHGGDESALLAAVDRALATVDTVDPESADGQWIAQSLLPLLRGLREFAEPSGRPLGELPISTPVGDYATQMRDTLEVSRAVAQVAAARVDPASEQAALLAMEKRVAQLPSGPARATGVGTLLVLWVTRAHRQRDPEAAARAIAWVPEAMEVVRGPEHPLYVRTAVNAATAYRLRANGGDRRRSRELAAAALRGQAWMVLLQSGNEHALTLAREASADAVRLARWCMADRAADELVAALDAGRGLVLQAAVTARGITDQLRVAGANDLADEWVAAGGDDSVEIAAMPGGDLHSDLRRRVLLVLGADAAAASSSMAQVQQTLATGRADALVYLVPADDAGPGLAVVVPSQGALEVLQLPDLHAGAAAALAGRVKGTGRDVTELDVAPGTPNAAPAGPGPIMEWAWRVAGFELAALADRLRPASAGPASTRPPRLVLVPFGPLALVPWHAARPANGAGLLERAVVSYAPSARLLDSALARPRHREGGVLVLGNPTGDLREAGVEARALVGAFYPEATYLGRTDSGGAEPSGPGAAAEMLALLGADARPLALLHLACHARANRSAPWRSGLVLADRPVDVGELLTVRRSTPLDVDTVCLAGCSTNVAGTDHDEAFSLASAFLAAGARTAFGSMWTVPDDHTSRLMFMVHHFLARGDDPADALHHAQLWAADPARVPPPEMPTTLARGAFGPDDPVAWAGFQHVGA